LKRTGEIRIHATNVAVWEEHVDEPAMLAMYRGVLGCLRRRGWSIERDPQCVKRYPSRHHHGRRGDLEFDAETGGRMAKVEFFQNVANVENPHGGRYDFDKFRRLPRHLRLPCVVAMTHVVRALVARGYTLAGVPAPTPRDVLRLATGEPPSDPLAVFNAAWGAGRFRRDATGWPTLEEYTHGTCGYNVDRDGVTPRNGETRYLRIDGRLARVDAYTNMNSMWCAWSHGRALTYVSCGELFRCDRPDLEPRRLVPGRGARLERELARATEAKNYRRVAVLATLLAKGADHA
jgi:hypothetical protein